MRIRSPVFVGRRAELEQLAALLDLAVAAQPRVAVIGGEAGVGKSRLVQEFAGVAADRGVRWLLGAAADYGEGGLPFGALVEALRPTGEVAFLLTGAGPAANAGADVVARQQVFERLLAVLAGLAVRQPVVLVLEDIHWADASTREFLAFVARNRESARLLVVATYRTDDVTREHPLRRYLLELQRDRVELISLSRFDRGELRQQLEAIREGQVDDRLVGALYERSQGNAFFSEELLASAVGNDLPAAVPPTLRDTMLARVDRLSADSRALLKLAAIAGTADEELLATVSGLDDERITKALREAIDRGVLQANDGAGYGFRHALLREATYQDMLAGERAKAHRRIAEALSAATGDGDADPGRLAQLAHHWELAGEPEQAFVAAWRAAVAADRVYAKPEASRLFERVGEMWPRVPAPAQLLRAELDSHGEGATPADRATVFHRAALSGASFGLIAGARLARRALEFVDGAQDPDRSVLLLDRISTWSRELGDPAAAHEADAELALVIDRASPNLRARLLLSRSDGAIVMGDFDRAREIADDALRTAERIGQTQDLLQALIIAARAKGYSGRPDEANRLFDRLRTEAAEANQPAYAAEADRWQGDLYQAAGRYEEAIALLRRGAARLTAIGEISSAEHTLVIAGQALYRSGRWAEAARELEAHPRVRWSHVLRAQLLVGQGRFEEAAAETEGAAEFTFLSRNSGSLGPYYAAVVEKQLWLHRPEEALATAEQALGEVYDDMRWKGELSVLGLRAAAELGGEARARADRIATHLRERAALAFVDGTIFGLEVKAALASAEAEMSRIGRDSSADLYAEAADAWGLIPQPYQQAYSLFRQAEALAATDRRAATNPLARAGEIARELGARPLLEAIESLASRARIRLGSEAASTADDLYGLTKREREVLRLLASGRSDREIADELFISPKTASVHVTNIKGKLGVERRIEAAAIGLKLGLDEP